MSPPFETTANSQGRHYFSETQSYDTQHNLNLFSEVSSVTSILSICSIHALRTFIVYLGFPMIHSEKKELIVVFKWRRVC